MGIIKVGRVIIILGGGAEDGASGIEREEE